MNDALRIRYVIFSVGWLSLGGCQNASDNISITSATSASQSALCQSATEILTVRANGFKGLRGRQLGDLPDTFLATSDVAGFRYCKVNVTLSGTDKGDASVDCDVHGVTVSRALEVYENMRDELRRCFPSFIERSEKWTYSTNINYETVFHRFYKAQDTMRETVISVNGWDSSKYGDKESAYEIHIGDRRPNRTDVLRDSRE